MRSNPLGCIRLSSYEARLVFLSVTACARVQLCSVIAFYGCQCAPWMVLGNVLSGHATCSLADAHRRRYVCILYVYMFFSFHYVI
jgi:hypothetical protein